MRIKKTISIYKKATCPLGNYSKAVIYIKRCSQLLTHFMSGQHSLSKVKARHIAGYNDTDDDSDEKDTISQPLQP